MNNRWFLVLILLVCSACAQAQDTPFTQPPADPASVPPATDPIITVPISLAQTPASSPSVPSQTPPSRADDPMLLQFTNFDDPRQTPLCAPAAPAPRNTPTAPLSLNQLKNAEYLSSDGYKRIHLINGAYLDPNLAIDAAIASSDRERRGTHLIEPVAYGDVDANGTEDAAIVLSTWGGGTGFWRDIVIMLNTDGAPASVAAIFFGDRDIINTVTVVHGDIVIDATSHGTSVRQRKVFRLCNTAIALVDSSSH